MHTDVSAVTPSGVRAAPSLIELGIGPGQEECSRKNDGKGRHSWSSVSLNPPACGEVIEKQASWLFSETGWSPCRLSYRATASTIGVTM